MNPEIKALMDEIKRAHEQFKAANDIALAQKADKGHVDVIVRETVERANTDVGALLDKLAIRVGELERASQIEEALGGTQRPDKMREELHAFAEMLSLNSADEGIRRQAQAIVTPQMYGAYKSGFAKVMRFAQAARLTPEEKAAMEVGSDPKGGYLVPAAIAQRVIELQYETTPMRQLAAIETTTLDRFPLDRDLDEADAGWVGETEARTETDTPEVGEAEIIIHEMYANPAATQKILDDAGRNIEEWLARKIANKFSRLENAAFVGGNTPKKPRGFLTYTAGTPSAATYERIQQVNSGASAAFASTNPGHKLIDLVHALKDAYAQNAKWLMARLTLAAVRKLVDGQDNYLWQPDFQSGPAGSLLSFPIVRGEDMPALAANSLSIAFGDFKQGYTIVDRAGIRVLRDPYTNKPKVQFYSTKRVGGDVANFEAIKLMKFAA